MKNLSYLLVAAFAVAGFSSAHADIDQSSVSPGYNVSNYYTSSNTTDNIVSFDWDASDNLYYDTATPSFNFGGLYEVSGTTTTNPVAGTSDFSGASVVAIGNYVYYNTSDASGDQNIYKYGPLNGTPANSLTSTTPSFGLYKHAGQLYITGSPDFGTNHIYHSALNANGSLASDPATDLGADSGSSGPLAFDGAGDLYYAPGFGDESVYKWTAAQVAAALANPAQNPLSIAEASQWLNYGTSSTYGSFSGGTSMIVDGNQLLLTLTNFGEPSVLAAFGIGSNGNWDGSSTSILNGTDTLGELRENDGNLFLSDDNSIFEIDVPEPSVALLLGGGLLLLVMGRHFRGARAFRRMMGIAALLPLLTGFAHAVPVTPFSPDADQPGSNGVSATDPNIAGWATGVVGTFTPGPVSITDLSGAKASIGTAQSALGPSDDLTPNGLTSPVVNLGDGGSITLSFAAPIANGPGADLAVFENGFGENGVSNAYFLELATVAVSSDGIHFFTFPSVSLTPTTSQVGSFGTLDPRNLYNLAGSEIAGYGTPFNLDDLSGINSPFLNLDDITEVRVTDVIGNIDTAMGVGTYTEDDATNPIFNGLYGTTDHVINDPFPTDFPSGGFDLDAIAELNVAPEPKDWALFLFGGLTAGIVFRRRLLCRD
jgi:hypothetical protein